MSGRFILSTTRLLNHARCGILSSTIRQQQQKLVVRHFESASPSTTSESSSEGLPDSIKRVGNPSQFPNEYPGMVYAFNWCLNGDGVTPLRRSAFRIMKPLDLKVAGLVPKSSPLKVSSAPETSMPEAGSDELTFEQFDEVSQRTRDLLSLSEHLYCPEGHVPNTRTGVRVITNSSTLAPGLLAYMERAPRIEPPVSMPITVYILEETTTEESFAGYIIEEVEAPIPTKDNNTTPGWFTGEEPEPEYETKSVAAVVVVDTKPNLEVIVTGMELCQKALAADEAERQAKMDAAAAGEGSE